MAKVTQDQKVQVGGAKFNKPKLRLRTRLMETLNRIFTTRQEKLAGEKGLLSTPMDRRRMLLTTGAAAVLAACAPLPAIANPNETPAAAKSKSGIKYETFSDPKELEPLFDNAKGKGVSLKRGETKTIGNYKLKIYHDGESGVVFQITPKGESSHMGVVLNDVLDNINILVIDAPANAGFKGKMLVFADYDTVYFQYFSKKEGRHELMGIPLHEGRMRKGPINTGFAFDGKSIIVVNAPKNLKPGDVVCQADYTPDVSGASSYFIYAPEEAPGTTIAMR